MLTGLLSSNTPLQTLFELGPHTTLKNVLFLRVIVHSVALAAIQGDENPFRVMFEQIPSLAGQYLPTMPEDEFASIRSFVYAYTAECFFFCLNGCDDHRQML